MPLELRAARAGVESRRLREPRGPAAARGSPPAPPQSRPADGFQPPAPPSAAPGVTMADGDGAGPAARHAPDAADDGRTRDGGGRVLGSRRWG